MLHNSAGYPRTVSDESTVDWTEADGVRWSEGVQLLGQVDDDALFIEPLSL